MEPWKPLSFKEFDALEKEPLERKVERAVAVMRAGMAEQLRTLRQFRADGSMSLLDLMPVEDVMEMRPCAFDTVSRLTLADDTLREYDADAWEDDET